MPGGGKQGANAKKTVEELYQKKTPLEHILLRPDTYIGSVQLQPQPLWVYDRATSRMAHRTITYCPGLYKIFGKSHKLSIIYRSFINR